MIAGMRGNCGRRSMNNPEIMTAHIGSEFGAKATQNDNHAFLSIRFQLDEEEFRRGFMTGIAVANNLMRELERVEARRVLGLDNE